MKNFNIEPADFDYEFGGKFIVYALCEENGYVRYIGKSTSGLKRVNGHRSEAFGKHRTYKNNWLKSKFESGVKPLVKILDESSNGTDLALKEKLAIYLYKTAGYNLTNLTNGGEGVSGRVLSEESRRKMSSSRKGIKYSDETRRNMSNGQRNRTDRKVGYKITETHRQRLRDAWQIRKLVPVSQDTRNKLSMVAKGRKLTEEHKRKVSEWNTGRKRPEWVRAKMRVAKTKYKNFVKINLIRNNKEID